MKEMKNKKNIKKQMKKYKIEIKYFFYSGLKLL